MTNEEEDWAPDSDLFKVNFVDMLEPINLEMPVQSGSITVPNGPTPISGQSGNTNNKTPSSSSSPEQSGKHDSREVNFDASQVDLIHLLDAFSTGR